MSLTEQVCNQAKFMAQELTADHQTLLETVAGAVARSLEARLRDEISPEDCLSDFVTAAGMYTAAVLEDLGGVEQFTAGDVTVRRASSRADELRKQAVTLMMPWIKAPFTFMGV